VMLPVVTGAGWAAENIAIKKPTTRVAIAFSFATSY
jgi:hypothetical protein